MHELREASGTTSAITALLRLLNAVLLHGGASVCEQACLVGVVPVALPFVELQFPQPIRLEAAILCHTMCTGRSALALQIFISCHGLPALVTLLVSRSSGRELEPSTAFHEPSTDHPCPSSSFHQVSPSSARELVTRAIDAIKAVLDLRGRAPRNDLCRTFVELEVLELIVPAIIDINAQYPQHADRGAEVVLQLSSADTAVKARMATRKVHSP